jgi:hypothetical protein
MCPIGMVSWILEGENGHNSVCSSPAQSISASSMGQAPGKAGDVARADRASPGGTYQDPYTLNRSVAPSNSELREESLCHVYLQDCTALCFPTDEGLRPWSALLTVGSMVLWHFLTRCWSCRQGGWLWECQEVED